METIFYIVITAVLVVSHGLSFLVGHLGGQVVGLRKAEKMFDYPEISQRTQPSGTPTQGHGSDNTG